MASWIWLDPSRWNQLWNQNRCLSYTANTIPYYTLTTLGARASASMVLISKAGILSPELKELKQGPVLIWWDVWLVTSLTVILHDFHGTSIHWQPNCLFSSLFWLTTNKISKLCITGPMWGESTDDLRFPSHSACNAESISMSWGSLFKCGRNGLATSEPALWFHMSLTEFQLWLILKQIFLGHCYFRNIVTNFLCPCICQILVNQYLNQWRPSLRWYKYVTRPVSLKLLKCQDNKTWNLKIDWRVIFTHFSDILDSRKQYTSK